MQQSKEFIFFKKILEKCRVRVTITKAESSEELDLGLRKMLGIDQRVLDDELARMSHKIIYRLADIFYCRYIFFYLPDESVAVLGPYLAEELTYAQLLELAELCSVPADKVGVLEKYYGSLPIISDDSPLFVGLHTFAEEMWGGADSYRVVDINRELSAEAVPFFDHTESLEKEETKWKIQILEQRYAYENQLMQAVEMGNSHLAEQLMQGLSAMAFERRLSDPLRNMKNYCIIMNTLMRKAAERGGVHPLYIDRLSSDFAKRIEAMSSINAVPALMEDIFSSYCRYVRQHSTSRYSPPIQRAILHIGASLNGDLSLKTIADAININGSYLSDLFKKETGQTITDYIAQKRIKRATRLLTTTKLQVQTIAQHCGMSDVNYFSKLFKKYTQKTPNQYRKEMNGRLFQEKHN